MIPFDLVGGNRHFSVFEQIVKVVCVQRLANVKVIRNLILPNIYEIHNVNRVRYAMDDCNVHLKKLHSMWKTAYGR